MMISAIFISLVTSLALATPIPDPLDIGLGIPAVVVDGQPIKVPEQKRGLADDMGLKSKFSIGDHTIEAGGGAVSVGGHATGGSVGNVIQRCSLYASSTFTDDVRILALRLVFISEAPVRILL